MRAVAIHVYEGRVGVGVVAEMRAALEIDVVFPASRVDDVGVGASAGGGIVHIVGGSLALVGEVAQTPGRLLLGDDGGVVRVGVVLVFFVALVKAPAFVGFDRMDLWWFEC